MTRVQKLITFSPKLYGHLQAKAERLGMGFAEYIRHLAVNDLQKELDKNFSNIQTKDAKTDS